MKKNIFNVAALVSSILLSTSISSFAANFNNDESVPVTPAITTSGKIIRVTVHFVDNIPGSIASASPVNTGIALSQNAITNWPEYSTYVRFDNADAGTTGTIDARNGGAMGTPANNLSFDLTKSYYIWFTVNLGTSKYSVSAQDATTSDVVGIATDFGFRATPITSVGFVSILHNGDNGDGAFLKIDEVTYPTSIVAGPVIQPTTAVRQSLAMTNKFKTSLSGNEVRFNQTVKSAEVFDLTGKIISKSFNVASLNIANFSKGICIIKTEAGMAKIIK